MHHLNSHSEDRGCNHPGCTVPGYGCQVHHAELDWADGGLTNITDEAFVCGVPPGLAGSLNNQSKAVAELGRREDALAAIEEAAALHRELAAILPVFRESLARSLTSFGIRLTRGRTSMRRCPHTGKL